jgi:hypothetical protein
MAKGTATDPLYLDDCEPASKTEWNTAPKSGRKNIPKATSSRHSLDLAKGTADDPVSLEDDAPPRPAQQTSTPAHPNRKTSSTPAQSEWNTSSKTYEVVISDDDSHGQFPGDLHVPSSRTGVSKSRIARGPLQKPFSRAATSENMSTRGISQREPSKGNTSGNEFATPRQPSSVAPRQSLNAHPINATNATNTAKVATAGPSPSAPDTDLPVLRSIGHESTPKPDNPATKDSSFERPLAGHGERADKESTPNPFPPQHSRPIALGTVVTTHTSHGGSKARDMHEPSTIPIRPSLRPTFSSSLAESEANVPSSPRARLAYVMDIGSFSSASKVVQQPRKSEQPVSEARISGSEQPTPEENQPEDPNFSSLTRPTKQDQPLKPSQARKTPSNIGPKRATRAPPSNLRTSFTNAPSISTATDAPGAKAGAHGSHDAVLEEVQKPAAVANALSPSKSVFPEQGVKQASDGSRGGQKPVTTAMHAMAAHNLEATTQAVDEHLRKHLQEVHQEHAQRVRICMRRQRLCFERQGLLKERGRAPTHATADKFVQLHSPFKKLQPIQTFVDNKGAKSMYFTQEIFTKARTKKGITSKMTTPTTRYRSTTVNVPAFRGYVSLQNNVLAENEKSMLNWPYFNEDPGDDMIAELEAVYKMKNVTHKWHALLSDFHDFYGPSADALLADIGLTWEDVLYWYLAPEPDIHRLNNTLSHASVDFRSALLAREVKMDERFKRSAPKWQRLLKNLPQPTPHRLRLASLACLSFSKQTDFDLWHIARRSRFLREEISKRLEGNRDGQLGFKYRKATCRVCQMHNCLFHGELREYPEHSHRVASNTQTTNCELPIEGDSDDEHEMYDDEEESSDDSDCTDSDIEDVDNYRRAANTHALAPYSSDEDVDQVEAAKPPGEFKAQWWINNTSSTTWERRKPFYPCSHEGTCDQARCRCFVENINCEKSCECSILCNRRFPGCTCTQTGAKQRACGTKACVCYAMDRECDGDLCGGCGATEILDPINRYNEDMAMDKCCNVALQRGVQKKTLLGHSEVHGFGLYTGEVVKKGDFLGEYKGEIVTLNEGVRREIVYEKQNTMYLFKLNKGRFILVGNHGTANTQSRARDRLNSFRQQDALRK